MIDQAGLGQKLRELRRQRAMTLATLSEKTRYSASALSKMENELLGLTYDKLTRITAALEVDIGSLFVDTPQVPPQAAGRRSIARRGQGVNIHTGFYDYLYLAPELSRKRFLPVLGKVHASSIEEFGPLIRHEGEEWMYVLKGRVEVHSEFYEPEILDEGDSIYLDSRMGHAFISKTAGGAEIISISTDSAEELIHAKSPK